MLSTADPKLDGRLDFAGTFAQLTAQFGATPPFPNGTTVTTTDFGKMQWNVTQGKWLLISQSGNLGQNASQMVRWKPVGNRAIAFTAVVAVGDTAKTLTGNWGGPTNLYPVKLSSGETVNALLTNGATTCPFFTYPTPPTVGSYGPAYAATLAATINATVTDTPPILGVANGFSASASIAAAGLAVLAGALAVAGVGVCDVPRNIVGAWTGASVVTVTGTDLYGQPMTEASANGTVFTGKKAFATVTSISSSAAITLATFGTGGVLGLPYRVMGGDFAAPVLNNATDAGTLVMGDITVPATTTTGDVRGTYAPAGALDGVKHLSAVIHISNTDPSRYRTLGVTNV